MPASQSTPSNLAVAPFPAGGFRWGVAAASTSQDSRPLWMVFLDGTACPDTGQGVSRPEIAGADPSTHDWNPLRPFEPPQTWIATATVDSIRAGMGTTGGRPAHSACGAPQAASGRHGRQNRCWRRREEAPMSTDPDIPWNAPVEEVLTARQGSLVRIRLNRPRPINALT